MKAMRMEVEDEYEKMEREQKGHQERVSKVILKESVIMLKDEMKVMDVVFEELKTVKSAVTQEEEGVLRKRTLQEAPKWDEAIRKEPQQLFEEKEALKKITEQEFQQLQQTWGKRLEVVPSKVVITLKPGPRRKIRLVACGNFVDRNSVEEKDRCLYASGTDAVCLRYVLKRGAEEEWKASVMGIRVAFLNAPLHNKQDVPTIQNRPCQAQRVLPGPEGHVRPQAIATMLGTAQRWSSSEDDIRRQALLRPISCRAESLGHPQR